jgi:hypothetical protein
MPVELIPSCHYFENNYVGSIARNALFDCSFWTLNDRAKLRIPRTSNFCEGWHNRFSKSIKYTKPSKPPLLKFLIGIFAEQNITENRLEKYNCDEHLTLQKKKPRIIDGRIRCIVYEYKRNFIGRNLHVSGFGLYKSRNEKLGEKKEVRGS